MRPRFLLDTNVIIRFLTQDDAAQLEKAKRLVGAAENGKCELLLRPWIVAEVVYVLRDVYGLNDRKQVADLLRQLAQASGIVTDRYVFDALLRYEKKNVDFAEALLAAEAAALGVRPASFDRDLDKFSDVKRLEPGDSFS
ncbi:MAG TPA: PIN domain-containing protein [Opitutaceae bacterium]|jgi:predicted nucleic-acid-binding protein|nr:PIN domain-containing protein [Opitutaceae bacterium]